MDGVLVLSEKQHFSAWINILEQHQLQLPTDWKDFNHLIGVNDLSNAQYIINHFNLNIDTHDLHRQKQQAFIEHAKNFDSHKGRDTFLQKASNYYQYALVSSASKTEIEKVIKTESLEHHFQFFIGCEDVTHHKPHPMPYLNALAKANIQPHEALVIEDSYVGIQAALSANIPVIGLNSPAVIPLEIKQKVKFFDDFDQIQEWLFA